MRDSIGAEGEGGRTGQLRTGGGGGGGGISLVINECTNTGSLSLLGFHGTGAFSDGKGAYSAATTVLAEVGLRRGVATAGLRGGSKKSKKRHLLLPRKPPQAFGTLGGDTGTVKVAD